MGHAIGPIQRDEGPKHTRVTGYGDDSTAAILSRARRVARDGVDPVLMRHGLEVERNYKHTLDQGGRARVDLPHGYPRKKERVKIKPWGADAEAEDPPDPLEAPKPREATDIPASPSQVDLDARIAEATADTSMAVGSKLQDTSAQSYLKFYGRRPFSAAKRGGGRR